MKQPVEIRHYRGRKVAYNSVNRLWWIKITTENGTEESRCRNTFKSACEEIDSDFARKTDQERRREEYVDESDKDYV